MKPGHGEVLLAEGDVEVAEEERALIEAFREQLDQGYYAVVTRGEGHAEQVRELPLDEGSTVILRRPIAGGC